jgi:hypothetical protein
MSVIRALRTGPIRAGIFEEKTAASLVIPYSTSSMYTTSASISPECGWALRVLSSFTTSTGFGDRLVSPVRGEVGCGATLGEGLEVGVGLGSTSGLADAGLAESVG